MQSKKRLTGETIRCSKTDKPANRVEDIHRSADVIVTFPGVDPERAGILGICGGGGYTIKAVQTDRRYKAVATLSMFNTGVVRRNGFLDGQTDTIQERLLQASKTHSHPKSTFSYTVSSLVDLMSFDAADNADLISQPLLMIAGSIADTFYMTEKVFASATGTQKKELYLIKGATHIETYWKPGYVKQAADKLVDFFGNNH